MALDLVALFDRAAELTTLAERLPLSVPLLDEYEFTSGFGMAGGCLSTGAGRRISGLDFAAPTRTPIYAPVGRRGGPCRAPGGVWQFWSRSTTGWD